MLPGESCLTAVARFPGLTRPLCFAAGALLFLSFGYTEMAGSDMWWHLAAGRELLQTRTLWMVDDWSWTARGEAWLNHEWLADLLYYAWVSAWGVASLAYWKWLVIVATFALLQQVLTRESGSALAGLLCAGMAAAVAAPFLDVRPHLYSLFNYSLLLALLLNRRAPVPLLALLFLVWVNLHGGFFFGLLALVILRFPWRNPGADELRAALATGLACVLACLLNPSGVKAFLYPLAYALDGDSPYRQLGEWLSPLLPGGIRSPLFFTCMWLPLLGLAWTLPGVRRAAGIPWEGIVLSGLTLAMALTSRRFIPLFGISLAVMLAPLLGAALRRAREERWGAAAALAALLWACYRLLPFPLGAGPAFHYLTAEYSYPEDTLNFLEANSIGGRVYALYNWGGYLHWRSDGRLQVFIDGRADTLFDAATYDHYVRVLSSRPGWVDELEASGAEYVLWPHARGAGQRKLRDLLATGRWRLLYRDAVSWLLVRSTVSLPASLRPPPDTPARDLTIGRASALSGDLSVAIDSVGRARRAVPWQRDACNLLTALHRQRGEPGRAGEILAECRRYFPSAMLRW
jgi:hypothetical protein